MLTHRRSETTVHLNSIVPDEKNGLVSVAVAIYQCYDLLAFNCSAGIRAKH